MRIVIAGILFLLLYVLQQRIYRKNWNRNLKVDIRFNRDYIECGESAELIEQIENQKVLPLPAFHLKFSTDRSLKFASQENSSVTDAFHRNEIFSIGGHTRITRRLQFTGTRRGIYEIREVSILVRDLFMRDTFAGMIHRTDAIYVFPEKINVADVQKHLKGMIGEMESRRSALEDALTFRGIRDYQPYDSFRSINWKQTARSGNLKVNLYGYSLDPEVCVMLNLDTEVMTERKKLLEKAISITSSCVRYLLQKNFRVSLITNGTSQEKKWLRPVPPGSSASHGISIDRVLTEITGSLGKDSFLNLLKLEERNRETGKMYLIISPYQKKDLLTLTDRMTGQGRMVRVISPQYREFPGRETREYLQKWEVDFS